MTHLVRRFAWLPVLASLALSGCFVQQPRKAEADAKAEAAYTQCDQMRQAGKYKTHLAAVDCAVRTVVAVYQAAGYPFEDLVYVSVQARRIGARKIDAGELTEEQYKQDLATLATRFTAEEDRRAAQIDVGHVAQPESPEKLVAGLRSFAPEPAPPPPTPLPPGANPNCVPLAGIRSCK